MNNEMLQKYAQLLIKVGVNLQQDESLVITMTKDGLELAKQIAIAAYDQGAKNIEFHFKDDQLTRLRYLHESDNVLSDIPQWLIMQKNSIVDRKACYINILSEDPQAFADVRPQTLARVSKATDKALKRYYDAATSNQIKWCLCAVPCQEWAKAIFPNDSADVAIDKLWQHIFECTRLNQPDPIAAWQQHIDRLQKISDYLTKQKFVKLYYHNNLGTHLEIGLPNDYYFSSGNEQSKDGVRFTANIPTEEIFTLPHSRTANGIVYSSMPLIQNGNIIDKFWLKFENGRIVDYGAEQGYETLKCIIENDEGSHYLGEIALVEFDSPIQRLNTLFYNTLFDENASCHLAIGEAYPMITGIDNMTDEQKKQLGVNTSCEHVDFMIGTSDLSVIAQTADGQMVNIMENGNFSQSLKEKAL